MLDTDSSDTDIGACLIQLHLNTTEEELITRREGLVTARLHLVVFFSHKLTPTQQRYSAQEQELLAIVSALEHWRH